MREGEYIERVLHCTVIFFFLGMWGILSLWDFLFQKRWSLCPILFPELLIVNHLLKVGNQAFEVDPFFRCRLPASPHQTVQLSKHKRLQSDTSPGAQLIPAV